MNTRIRYFETNEENVIQSVKTFQHPNEGSRFKVLINKTQLKYTIMEDTINKEVASGRACNLHQVKMKAKSHLIALGIPFAKEEERVRVEKPVQVEEVQD